MTKQKLESILKNKQAKHLKEEAKREKDWKKQGYTFKPRKFDLGLPYKPRLGLFKSSSGKNYFDPIQCKAVSYNWWTYVTKLKGRVIFNDHRYSVTTSTHQADTRRLMANLGIKIDIYVDTRSSIENTSGLQSALAEKYTRIIQNQIAIKRRGSNKRSNKYRFADIKGLRKDIKALKSLGLKFSQKDIKALTQNLLKAEAERIEKMRAESIERKKLRNEAEELLNNSFVTDQAQV
jgi:hypothetical protein